jgi:hypothetical protein
MTGIWLVGWIQSLDNQLRNGSIRFCWYCFYSNMMGGMMGLKEHEYIRQTLERYTNCKLEDFCSHVLITNFRQYIKAFADRKRW